MDELRGLTWLNAKYRPMPLISPVLRGAVERAIPAKSERTIAARCRAPDRAIRTLDQGHGRGMRKPLPPL